MDGEVDCSPNEELNNSKDSTEYDQMWPARQSPHLHQPSYLQGLQHQQSQELFSRINAMMTMTSTTQQFALNNQTSQQQLQEKLDSLAKKIQVLKKAKTTFTTSISGFGQKKLEIKKLLDSGSERLASEEL